MGAPAKRRLGWEDVLAASVPDGPVPELHEGELVWKALPRARHARAGGRLYRQLGPYDDDETPDGWWILPEAHVRLAPHEVVCPDIAGWRRSRLASLPEGTAPIDVVPDWTCEVLSPGHERDDLVRKRTTYLEFGVGWYWIVDPEARTLEGFASEGGRWVLLGTWTDGDVVRVAPFEAVDVEVARLFVP